MSSQFTVGLATPDEVTSACRYLFAYLPEPECNRRAGRCQELIYQGEIDPAGLVVARDASGTLCGSGLAQILPGAIGLAWFPHAASGVLQQEIEDALVSAASSWLKGNGVRVVQSFASPGERPAASPLERYGFRRITRVMSLRREIDKAHGKGSFRQAGLTITAVTSPLIEPFPQTLIGTYDGTLDCPELNGTRTTAEILEGFRGNPDRLQAFLAIFLSAKQNPEPVGVLLLDTNSYPEALEIGYLGLLPTARGQGLGNYLVRFAIAQAVDKRVREIRVSVDIRNEPALRLYQRHGFRPIDQQDVYLAVWPNNLHLPCGG